MIENLSKSELVKLVYEFLARLDKLEQENKSLIEELAYYKNPKNSRNSSIPPSKDENRPLKTKSLRTSSGKKPGGQKGHEGTTLVMAEKPDFIVEHKPGYCQNCGKDISTSVGELIAKRQIVDIPPIIPQCTEYQLFEVKCTCGHHNVPVFPDGVNAPIGYGSNVEAAIAYMHSRQYLPLERMAEYFSDICGLPITQGAICNILERFAKKAANAYELIAKKLENSKVVGSDETGAKVNGKKGWFWTWQNNLLTYIAFSFKRGTSAIMDNFPKGFIFAVLVHDCWKSHFATKVKTHQICIAHLLRELRFFEERFLSDWATLFKKMLYSALELKNDLSPPDYIHEMPKRNEIEERLLVLLQSKIPSDMTEVCVFQNRMIKYRDYIFTFLYYPDVPPDNNGSERAIRNVKVKQKVSGQFKTQKGAEIYAIIRSVTDTCIKNGQNILAAFKTIATLQPE
jgi:transposase